MEKEEFELKQKEAVLEMDTEMEVEQAKIDLLESHDDPRKRFTREATGNVKLWLHNFPNNSSTPDLEGKESANTSVAKISSQRR